MPATGPNGAAIHVEEDSDTVLGAAILAPNSRRSSSDHFTTNSSSPVYHTRQKRDFFWSSDEAPMHHSLSLLKTIDWESVRSAEARAQNAVATGATFDSWAPCVRIVAKERSDFGEFVVSLSPDAVGRHGESAVISCVIWSLRWRLYLCYSFAIESWRRGSMGSWQHGSVFLWATSCELQRFIPHSLISEAHWHLICKS